jgi:hypothetical protein
MADRLQELDVKCAGRWVPKAILLRRRKNALICEPKDALSPILHFLSCFGGYNVGKIKLSLKWSYLFWSHNSV